MAVFANNDFVVEIQMYHWDPEKHIRSSDFSDQFFHVQSKNIAGTYGPKQQPVYWAPNVEEYSKQAFRWKNGFKDFRDDSKDNPDFDPQKRIYETHILERGDINWFAGYK